MEVWRENLMEQTMQIRSAVPQDVPEPFVVALLLAPRSHGARQPYPPSARTIS